MRIKYWTTDDIRPDNGRFMEDIDEVSFGSVQPSEDEDRPIIQLTVRSGGAPTFISVTNFRVLDE